MEIDYKKILERLLVDIKGYQNKMKNQLNLDASRKILQERIEFVDNFYTFMKNELFL